MIRQELQPPDFQTLEIVDIVAPTFWSMIHRLLKSNITKLKILSCSSFRISALFQLKSLGVESRLDWVLQVNST